MTKKYNFMAISFLAAFSITSVASAGIITGWNTDGVSTEPPNPDYITGTTYYSTIFTDVTGPDSNGAVVWKHGDVQPPGLKVVNGDDVNGSNCIMTTGYHPEDFSDKMCSDPLQFSKRFKLKSLLNGPLDVDYHVSAGELTSYRVFQKWTDSTDKRWSEFTVQLGFTVNGEFVPSTVGDGLGYSDTRGRYITSTTSYQAKEDMLSATFAQGLAGPADKYHPDTGYFNTTTRMTYGLLATEDTLSSDGISDTYTEVFGAWVNSPAVPIAIFYDADGVITTDNILMANCAEASNLMKTGTQTGDDITGFTCNGQWVTFKAQPGLDSEGEAYPSDGVPKPITFSDLTSNTVHTSIEHAIASGDANPFYMDYVEDASNLGFTFWITVDDNSNWPTPDGFTVRYTPVVVAAPPVAEAEVCTDTIDNDLDGLVDCDDTQDCATEPACDVPPPADEICDDGIDNDGNGATDCADPACAGAVTASGTCGLEGKFTTCSDGFDNDGDGDVDCDDSGCAKNKSCR